MEFYPVFESVKIVMANILCGGYALFWDDTLDGPGT